MYHNVIQKQQELIPLVLFTMNKIHTYRSVVDILFYSYTSSLYLPILFLFIKTLSILC